MEETESLDETEFLEFSLFTVDGLIQAFPLYDIQNEEILKEVFKFREEFYAPDELYVTGYVKSFGCHHLMVMFTDGEFDNWKNMFKYEEKEA